MLKISYLLVFLSLLYLALSEHVGYDSISLLTVDNENDNKFILLSIDVTKGSVTPTEILQVEGEIVRPSSVFDPYNDKYYVAYELHSEDGRQQKLSIINFENKTLESDIIFNDEDEFPIKSLTFDMSTKDVVALFISPNNAMNKIKALNFRNGNVLWSLDIPGSHPVTFSSDYWTGLISFLESKEYGYFASQLEVRNQTDSNFNKTLQFSDMEFGSVKGYFTNGSVLAIGRYLNSKSSGLYKISLLEQKRPEYIVNYPPLDTHKTISLASTSYIDETLTFYSTLVPEGKKFKIMTSDIQTREYSETIKFSLDTNKYTIIGMNVELNDNPIFQPVFVPEEIRPPSEIKKSQKIGMILGIILGSVAIVGLIIGIIVFRKRKYSFYYSEV